MRIESGGDGQSESETGAENSTTVLCFVIYDGVDHREPIDNLPPSFESEFFLLPLVAL